MKNMIIVITMLVMLMFCASVPKQQITQPELVVLDVHSVDLAKFHREDSLMSLVKPSFSPPTRLTFSMLSEDSVFIKLFDVHGDSVSHSYKALLEMGDYQVRFDGSKLTSGIYFMRRKIGEKIVTSKFMLLK